MAGNAPSRPRRKKAQVGAAGLIDIGEALLGRHGLDGISMRQVSTMAGLSNPASVQYHFGNRDELIRAIWEKRLPGIDASRRRLLARLDAEPSLLALLDCLCRPFAYEFRSFAQFLGRVLRSGEHLQSRLEFNSLAPTSQQISDRIAALLPLERDVLDFRLLSAILLVLDALASPSPTAARAWQEPDIGKAYREALAAALGCLTAPVATPLP